jgi:hypothetical protein
MRFGQRDLRLKAPVAQLDRAMAYGNKRAEKSPVFPGFFVGLAVHMALEAYHQHSITSAQRRYLAAIKTPAVVRWLALPALQINIAQMQQVKNA